MSGVFQIVIVGFVYSGVFIGVIFAICVFANFLEERL